MDSSHQKILKYDPKWIELYEAETVRLRALFGNSCLGIQHIGSTSIPGLDSKPIIDIMVLVNSDSDAERFVPALENMGYSFDRVLHSNTVSPERHFFRLGNPTTHHLSIAYSDKGSFWKRQIAFRDYVRLHPEERERYSNLKKSLLAGDPTGTSGYIVGKTDLVNEILDKSGFVRWEPPAGK